MTDCFWRHLLLLLPALRKELTLHSTMQPNYILCACGSDRDLLLLLYFLFLNGNSVAYFELTWETSHCFMNRYISMNVCVRKHLITSSSFSAQAVWLTLWERKHKSTHLYPFMTRLCLFQDWSWHEKLLLVFTSPKTHHTQHYLSSFVLAGSLLMMLWGDGLFIRIPS